MPPRMSFPQALSILHAHAAKHDAELLIDRHLVAVARGVSSGVHAGLFEDDLAEAIAVAWEHFGGRVGRLDYFFVEPTGDWASSVRLVEKEGADE